MVKRHVGDGSPPLGVDRVESQLRGRDCERALATFRGVPLKESGASPAVSAHPIDAQRRRLWATATRSITLVTLASPRTLNWDTP